MTRRRQEDRWFYEYNHVLVGSKLRALPDPPSLEQADDELEVLDPKFMALWERIGDQRIQQMVMTSAELDAKEGHVEDGATAWMRWWGVRHRVHRFWLLREKARAEQKEAVSLAWQGALGKTPEEREICQRIARGLALRVRNMPGDEHLFGEENPPYARWILAYMRACQLSDLGDMGRSHELMNFAGHREILSNDPLPIPPRGLAVSVFRDRSGGIGVWERIPVVSTFDWRAYDHVIGCATTIEHDVLDIIGVPRRKQHIIDPHYFARKLDPDGLPCLRGRIAVVDDVHEGQTSRRLARTYRADVVDVVSAKGSCCSDIYPAPQPIATIRCDAAKRCMIQKLRRKMWGNQLRG